MNMKKIIATKIICSAVGVAFSINAFAFTPEARGNDPHMSVSGKTISMAVKALGHKAKRYKDASGNPHFVVTDKIGNAKDVAIFTGDCGSAGCEDVIFYANMGKKKLSQKAMNQWNHISAKLRSKVAVSSNGEVTLSMPVSFLSDGDVEKLGLAAGMFFAEINMLSATIDSKK